MPKHRKRETAGQWSPAEERDWLTLGQASAFLGAAQSTVRKWADRGLVPTFYTPGGHRRFRRDDLEAFLLEPRGGVRVAPTRRGTILVVDDDPALREFLRVNLEGSGHTVQEAASSGEGLAALDRELPDLILLDVMMPEVDDWEMLRRVRERHGVDAMPVIMYCGKLGDPADSARRGAQAFIGKPFDPTQLLERTAQLLGSR
jgi:excisionase family DNA binding protein